MLINNGTSLHIAAGGKYPQIIDISIDRGLDVNTIAEIGSSNNEDEEATTALYIAMSSDRLLLADKLIQHSLALFLSVAILTSMKKCGSRHSSAKCYLSLLNASLTLASSLTFLFDYCKSSAINALTQHFLLSSSKVELVCLRY